MDLKLWIMNYELITDNFNNRLLTLKLFKWLIIMNKLEIPVTQATRLLKDKKINFIPYVYEYEEKGGTAQTAEVLNVPEYNVIKTLVLQTDTNKIFIMLMHGDYEVSLKELARILDVKTITPCEPKTAQNATGYLFGGTSPFGTRKMLPLYAESTIFDLDKIYINGGKRGFIIEIDPQILKIIFDLEMVDVKIKR